MKLWILRPIDGLAEDDNPWEPWYDKIFGFVIRATNEDEARQFAHKNAGEENRGECGEFSQKRVTNTATPWLDSKYTTCDELIPEGVPGLIMQDFYAA